MDDQPDQPDRPDRPDKTGDDAISAADDDATREVLDPLRDSVFNRKGPAQFLRSITEPYFPDPWDR